MIWVTPMHFNFMSLLDSTNLGRAYNKHISFDVSRHTWTTRVLRKEITIEKVAEILGYADLRQTLIYNKIIGEDLDKAMNVFN
jgi:site-specific recombinase XerD